MVSGPPQFENQLETTRVESLLVPRLDEGSNPSISTFNLGLSDSPEVFCALRLYCIRLSDKILIFGNGGVKDCATWQESESLSDYVETLVDTSRFISSRLSNGTLYIVDKEIIGNLNFTHNEKK